MGNILWWRKRPPSEELDELVVQIRELETQLKQLLNDRTGILRWLNCFVLLVVTVLSALGWLQHGPLRKRLLSVAFVWLCALLVLALFRYLITSAFGWLIRRKRNRINLFVERKLAIIENVKKNENYNVAVEYIKKYCDEGAMEKKNGGGGGANGNNSPSFGRANKNGGGASRRRGSKEENGGAGEQHQFHNTTPNGGGVRHAATSVPQSAAIGADTNNTKMVLPKLYEMQDKDMTPRWASSSMFATATPSYHHHHQRTPIRPFIEPSRTPVDRVLDFLVGESINSRYALICSICHTHNGMALQEEFDSLSFLCFKCNSFNPSKNEQKLTVMSSSSSSTPTSAPPGVVNEDNKSET